MLPAKFEMPSELDSYVPSDHEHYSLQFLCRLQKLRRKKTDATQKFALEMIGRLMENANMRESQRRSQHSNSPAKAATSAATQSSEPPPKRQSHASGRIFLHHVQVPTADLKPRLAHVRTALDQKFKGACVVCSQLHADRKAAGETIDWDKVVKRTKMVCRH